MRYIKAFEGFDDNRDFTHSYDKGILFKYKDKNVYDIIYKKYGLSKEFLHDAISNLVDEYDVLFEFGIRQRPGSKMIWGKLQERDIDSFRLVIYKYRQGSSFPQLSKDEFIDLDDHVQQISDIFTDMGFEVGVVYNEYFSDDFIKLYENPIYRGKLNIDVISFNISKK